MSVVDVVTIRLVFAAPERLRPAPHLLRGALAGLFPDCPLMHQHDGERVLYRYPQVQYRWDEEGPLVVGLHEGARFWRGWTGADCRCGWGKVETTIREAEVPFVGTRSHGRHIETLPFRGSVVAVVSGESRPLCDVAPGRASGRTRPSGWRWQGYCWRCEGSALPCRVDCVMPPSSRWDRSSAATRECRWWVSWGVCWRLRREYPEGLAMGRAISHGYGWLLPFGLGGRQEQ